MDGVTVIRICYSPHPKQRAFHESPAKYRAFVGGVGSGKTTAGVNEALYQALIQPGSLGVMVAPTFPMVRDVTLRAFLATCPEQLIVYANQTQMRWRLINGSEILFRSADKPERLRGLTIAWFGIDEAAYVSEETFLVLQARLRQRGYQHRGWLTTTPKGKNWIYKYFVEKDGPEYALIQCSSRENPYLPAGFVDDLAASYAGVFARQEIDGEFVSAEGLVYSGFRRQVHVRDGSDRAFAQVVAGADFGFTNPAVILVVGVDGDGRAWVVDEFYERRVLPAVLVEQAAQMARRWGVSAFYCDPSEPGFIAMMQEAGLPAVPGNNELIPGIAEVSGRLAVQPDGLPRLFVGPTCIHTIAEFEQYRYPSEEAAKRRGAGEVPIKAFDHAMDALRYAVMGIRESSQSLLLWE